MDKLIALILSVITALSGFFSAIPGNAADILNGLITGIPFGEYSINDDFIGSIDLSQVSFGKNGAGYYDKIMIMFFDRNCSVAGKYEVFKKYGLTLLGWACPADMFIVSSPVSGCERIASLGKEIEEEFPAVLMASPVPCLKSSPDTTPDDPFDSGYGWNDADIMRSGRWSVDAVHIREAWNYAEYFNDIKVGVVDSGFDTEHEDLKEKISFPTKCDKKLNVPGYHGTFVAGIIAAEYNNGKGTAGINPKAGLVCVDWKKDEGQDWNETLRIFFGICRLVKSGVKVLNMSLGTSGNIDPDDPDSADSMNAYAGIYSAMMSVMLAKGYDFVAVQSAGNGDKNDKAVDSFFNAHFATFREDNIISLIPWISKSDLLDRVIIVGAAAYRSSDRKYHLTSFSNFGDGVTIAAPGSRLYGLSTGDKEYMLMSGTSAAAPVVAGVASLVWCVNPELTGAQVKKIITENAGETVYPYKEEGKNYKLVNAKNAVEAALKTKYKMFSLTGEVDTGGYNTPADLITIKSGEKSKDITALSGKIDLIYESGDGTIIINGEYGGNAFDDVAFSVSDKDVDLGKIEFRPGQEDSPPATADLIF